MHKLWVQYHKHHLRLETYFYNSDAGKCRAVEEQHCPLAKRPQPKSSAIRHRKSKANSSTPRGRLAAQLPYILCRGAPRCLAGRRFTFRCQSRAGNDYIMHPDPENQLQPERTSGLKSDFYLMPCSSGSGAGGRRQTTSFKKLRNPSNSIVFYESRGGGEVALASTLGCS